MTRLVREMAINIRGTERRQKRGAMNTNMKSWATVEPAKYQISMFGGWYHGIFFVLRAPLLAGRCYLVSPGWDVDAPEFPNWESGVSWQPCSLLLST
jgi:hypothetical protein